MGDKEFSILIVDDQPSIRSLLTEILGSGYSTMSAGGASEALRLLGSRYFHIALIDLGLPGMSGLSLCRLVKNRYPLTSVIVVSGQTDEQSIEEAIRAGASAFLCKPFAVQDVIAAVNAVLDQQSPGAVA